MPDTPVERKKMASDLRRIRNLLRKIRKKIKGRSSEGTKEFLREVRIPIESNLMQLRKQAKNLPKSNQGKKK